MNLESEPQRETARNATARVVLMPRCCTWWHARLTDAAVSCDLRRSIATGTSSRSYRSRLKKLSNVGSDSKSHPICERQIRPGLSFALAVNWICAAGNGAALKKSRGCAVGITTGKLTRNKRKSGTLGSPKQTQICRRDNIATSAQTSKKSHGPHPDAAAYSRKSRREIF